jgi:transcriptional regulator
MEACDTSVGNPIKPMREKTDVLQGTLALMVLKTLDVLGPQHGYGIARRIEQISGDLLTLNQGTLYPVLLRLEQEGSVASEWGASENNRKARFYRLTRQGRKQLQAETQDWEQRVANNCRRRLKIGNRGSPSLGGSLQ